jgi:hypothetical protein
MRSLSAADDSAAVKNKAMNAWLAMRRLRIQGHNSLTPALQ